MSDTKVFDAEPAELMSTAQQIILADSTGQMQSFVDSIVGQWRSKVIGLKSAMERLQKLSAAHEAFDY